MPPLTHRLQLLLDDARRQRLEEESERTGAPVSELIRRAIDAMFPGQPALAGESAPPTSWDRPDVEVPADVRALLESEVRRSGRPIESVLREAVARGLERPRPRPGILDAEPMAERTDELLDGFGQR